LQKKRSTASCYVRQTANLDYTEPEFEISIRAEDDRSLVRLLLNIGTVPGGSNVLHEFELGGPSTIVREVSYAWGFPVFQANLYEGVGGIYSTTLSMQF